MISKKNKKLKQKMESILSLKNDKDKLAFETYVLQSDFLRVLEQLMDREGVKPADLARKIDVKPSFISQIFSGDKRLNLVHMALFQRVFKDKFIFSSYSLNLLNLNNEQENECKIIPIKTTFSNIEFIDNIKK